MKRKEKPLPKLDSDALKEALWETIHKVKDKKLSYQAGASIAKASDSIVKIVKEEINLAKLSSEMGQTPKIAIGTRKDSDVA